MQDLGQPEGNPRLQTEPLVNTGSVIPSDNQFPGLQSEPESIVRSIEPKPIRSYKKTKVASVEPSIKTALKDGL